MCSEYASSSRLFLPTTPPTLHFDQVSIVDGSVSEQETILESPSDPLSHGLLPNRVFGDQSSKPFELDTNCSSRRAEKRRASSIFGPPSSTPGGRSRKRIKMNMNMAEAGSMAALPGIQTPLATYVAQMVVWLWYGDFQNQSQSLSASPNLNTPPIPNSPFDVMIDPPPRVTPLMVHPSPQFSKFVARLLQVTMVSHSVTVIALLYIYRLKMNNQFFSTPGSEQRPFVAGLMLGNKYLDDNTYTNATWAELTSMPLPEINKMETELLNGLEYRLGVDISEYQRWKTLLDEFMTSRGPGGAAGRHARQLSAGKNQQVPRLLTTPIAMAPSSSRARSASPPRYAPSVQGSYVFPTVYDNQRKYSAADVYPPYPNPPATAYSNFTQSIPSSQRLPSNVPVVRARPPALTHQASNSSLNRSTSLNREYSRSSQAGESRRGSAGHIYETPMDPNPMSTELPNSYGQMVVGRQGEWDGGRALLAPYEFQAQPQLVPPEHLMFYSLAAAPHPGVDGAPRKAILRYQDPSHPFMFPSAPNPNYAATPSYTLAPSTTYGYEDVNMSDASTSPMTLYPSSVYEMPQMAHGGPSIPTPHTHYDPYNVSVFSPMHADPEPAQFANAGPPGYVYHPPNNMAWQPSYAVMPPATARPNGLGIDMGMNGASTSVSPAVSAGPNMNRWSLGSEEGLVGLRSARSGAGGLMWAQNGSRSEWSSPMVKYEQV